jgi:hypothetical protein
MKITNVEISARVNLKVNKKISAYEYLSKWKDDPDVYISFTAIDKLGINPKSIYNTPVGIYTYPLQACWEEYGIDIHKTLTRLPFAATQPHIWVVRVKDKQSFVNDLYTEYGSNKFDKDFKKLKKIFMDECWKQMEHEIDYTGKTKKEVKDNAYNLLEEAYAEKLKGARSSAHEQNPSSIFWNLSRMLASDLTNGNALSKATKWNWLLRQCGYSGFADKSKRGIIHNAEPLQAVFLTRQAFTVIGECLNKDYTGPSSLLKVHSNPSESVQLAEVKKKGWDIEYIIKRGIIPSEAVKAAAIKNDPGSIAILIRNNIPVCHALRLEASKYKPDILWTFLDNGIVPEEDVIINCIIGDINDSVRFLLQKKVDLTEKMLEAIATWGDTSIFNMLSSKKIPLSDKIVNIFKNNNNG